MRIRFAITAILLLLGLNIAAAQEIQTVLPPLLDSALVGVNPSFYVTEGNGNIKINGNASIDNAFVSYINANRERKIHGYRIRIFFDNKQNARNESEKIETEFKEAFPLVPVYRTYSNPYFKVAAGDYRSKSDALEGLEKIKSLFPNAFIIRETINYPAI